MTYINIDPQEKEKCEEILKNSTAMFDIKIDTHLNSWSENKKWLYDLFGGQTRIVKPISLKKDETILKSELNTLRRKILGSIPSGVEGLYRFLYSLSEEELYENKILKENRFFPNVPKGMKVTRAMKLVEKDTKLVSDIQTELSKVYNDKMIKGNLVVSIDPSDYLTISESGYGWRSCMALDGEYATGLLEYLMDGSTVVAYLEGTNEHEVYGIPHNSKKWRQLFYLHPSSILSSKGYPFASESLTNEVFDMLLEPMGIESYDRIMYNKRNISNLRPDGFKVNITTEVAYLDVCEKNGAELLVDKKYNLDVLGFDTGYRPMCISCGECDQLHDAYMVCISCGDFSLCEYCDEIVYDPYFLGEDCICEACWDHNAIFCERCEEVYHKDDDDVVWDEDLLGYYCSCCHREVLAEIEENEKESSQDY